MKKDSKTPQRPTLREMPFEQLVTAVTELAAARQEYGGKSPKERRAAAEWAYDSGMASDLFSRAVLAAGGGADLDGGFDSGVVALAMDPLYAPALLTVGSLEYQHKRPDAAMAMFLALTTLPPGEPDLDEIIDKAGCFLLDQGDNSSAMHLYRTATEAYPGVCEHWSNLSYCLGKAGQLDEAVSTARKALSLKENDPRVLNDLGWTLVLAGFHEEARTVLERSATLAPADYELPRNNLRELDNRMRKVCCRSFALVLFMGVVGTAAAAEPFRGDVLRTSDGDLTMAFVGEASLMFVWNGIVIHVDPFGMVADYAEFPKADLVLITHPHMGHMDLDAIRTLMTTNTTLVLAASCWTDLPRSVVMTNGSVRIDRGVRIEAVPAYNIFHSRDDGEPYHARGHGNGYVLTFGDKRVYVAGDTENTPEMKALAGIDVAFLPLSLPSTMTPAMAADAALALKPRILYPYHYEAKLLPELTALLEKVQTIEIRIRRTD